LSLEYVLREIQSIVGDVAGIRAAPEFPPEKPPPGIFSVVLPTSGTFKQAPVSVLCGLHDVDLYVICPRVDLPKTMKTILPLGELVAAALENSETLNSMCSTFDEIPYVFETSINLGTAAMPSYYSGWVFTIKQIKVQDQEILT